MISIKIKYPSRFINILDFNPKKLSIEKVTDAVNDELEYIYYIKCDKDPFYLVINDLKGIMEDQRQRKIYNQIYDKIKELINSVDGANFKFSANFRDGAFIRFDTDDTLLSDAMVSVYSMAIVIRSVYRNYYDRFYPQIHLANCIYKKS